MRSLVMGRWCSHVMGCSRMCYLVMRRLSVDGFMVCCLRMRNLAMLRLRMRTFVMFCFWACAFVVHCFGLSALVMYGRGLCTLVMYGRGLCTLVMHGGRLSSGVGSNYGVRAALIDRVTLVAVISSFLLVRALRGGMIQTSWTPRPSSTRPAWSSPRIASAETSIPA